MTRSGYNFRPEDYEAELAAVIRELLDQDLLDQSTYETVLRRHPKDGRGFFSKSEIIRGFRHLNQKLGWQLEERSILEKLRMKPIRTQSGVAPVTVLTKPYPCPGKCIFCPSDVRMPKSYLSSEPGAQRAAQHQFDPFEQSYSRLRTYHNIGHPSDKVDRPRRYLVVLPGGLSSLVRQAMPGRPQHVRRFSTHLGVLARPPTPRLSQPGQDSRRQDPPAHLQRGGV